MLTLLVSPVLQLNAVSTGLLMQLIPFLISEFKENLLVYGMLC